MFNHLNVFIPFLALVAGFVPSAIWLVFWLNAARKHHEPRRLLILAIVSNFVLEKLRRIPLN